MKKPTVMLLGLVLISAISMAMISPAKADVGVLSWRPIYVSKDSDTVIYEDGVTASCIVGITNNIAPGFVMNVSKIILEFYQIGKNKTLDLSAAPHQLQYNQVELFTVSFTAYSSEFFSGYEFDSNLIVEWVNATTGPTKVVGYWDLPPWWTGLQALEVYTAAQVDTADSLAKYYAYYNEYYWYDWDSTLAEQKATQATIEKAAGDTYSQRGDYTSALTHYNSANTLWEEALTAEFSWRDTWEDAELNVTLTEASANSKEADAAVIEANAAMVTAEAAKAQADAALTNAYGWYFIGIGFALGWTLMGIGAIIWAWKRPKPTA
jgi:tetratricopeptide (TPR) repeat protein